MGQSILFACSMNSVRSPMAEAVARHILPPEFPVGSCGVYRGVPDPFVAEVLKKAGIPPSGNDPREFGDCRVENFDVVIALAPEAAAEARKFHKGVEYWDVENPTDTRGSEEEILAAYARLKDDLIERITRRFLERKAEGPRA